MRRQIDQQRIRQLLAGSYQYYSKDDCSYETIGPLTPDTEDLLSRALKASMSVLDVGCGDGRTLLRHASAFRCGVGIDECADEIEAAKMACTAHGVSNLRFTQCFINYKARNGDNHNALPFESESFDLVLCERGPLAYCDNPLSEAMRVLKPGGLLFVETLGERNLMEVRAAFEPEFRRPETYLSSLEAERIRFERHGVRISTLTSMVLTLRFPDIYEWLEYQCSVWAYLGKALPSGDDMQPVGRLLALAADDFGGVSITYHPIWLSGTKPLPSTVAGEAV